MTPTQALDLAGSQAVRGDFSASLSILEAILPVITETPEWIEANFVNRLGLFFLKLHKPTIALPLFLRAQELDPSSRPAHYNLSYALIMLGRRNEALAAFSGIVTPWDGTPPAPASVANYEVNAADYDANELSQYFSQRLLVSYSNAAPARRIGAALDLGCGSGLLGTRIPASATSLTGIDISPAMLELARQRGVYDQLLAGDMTRVMAELPTATFDTAFAACTLYHMADLSPIFTQVGRLLKPGGIFAFSVDPAPDHMEIGTTGPGEYCHGLPYLRHLAETTGFSERGVEIDRHRGPPGFWVVLCRN